MTTTDPVRVHETEKVFAGDPLPMGMELDEDDRKYIESRPFGELVGYAVKDERGRTTVFIALPSLKKYRI